MVILIVMAGSCAVIAVLFRPLDSTVVELIDEDFAEETRELRSSRHAINAAVLRNQNGSTPSLDTKDVSLRNAIAAIVLPSKHVKQIRSYSAYSLMKWRFMYRERSIRLIWSLSSGFHRR